MIGLRSHRLPCLLPVSFGSSTCRRSRPIPKRQLDIARAAGTERVLQGEDRQPTLRGGYRPPLGHRYGSGRIHRDSLNCAVLATHTGGLYLQLPSRLRFGSSVCDLCVVSSNNPYRDRCRGSARRNCGPGPDDDVCLGSVPDLPELLPHELQSVPPDDQGLVDVRRAVSDVPATLRRGQIASPQLVARRA